MKCLHCKSDFEPSCSNQKFCSWKCQLESGKKIKMIERKIEKISDEFSFEVKNKDRIINAKKLLLGTENIIRCPCDAHNPDRYCGSALCIHDVIEFGKCHCGLFNLPEGKEPLCKKK